MLKHHKSTICSDNYTEPKHSNLIINIDFKVKKDYQKVYGEIGKLYDREDELLVEEECLVNETNEVQVEIEQKEYRREALLKNMNNMCEDLLYEKYR